jgi:hypothetical protein
MRGEMRYPLNLKNTDKLLKFKDNYLGILDIMISISSVLAVLFRTCFRSID